jgi:hypothetical protein
MMGAGIGSFEAPVRRLAGNGDASRQWLRAEPLQLQIVVGKTDQRPLALKFSQAAQEELAKPAGLFDLAEDRLDDRFPCQKDCPPRPGLKLAFHAVDPRRIAG